MEERLLVKLANMSNLWITMYQMSDSEYTELKANMLFTGSIIDEKKVIEWNWYVGRVFDVELYHNKK
jgi:hypothetical protein